MRGYRIAPNYDSADLVVVNTCGFIESAIDESLQAIGEAMQRHGRVLVTGCLGANPQRILERHPNVLGVTGPHAYERVIAAVNEHLPAPHAPFVDLLPPQGVRLTPRHYAYLKISEGCNNRCSFCIIPALRGALVSRPLDHVMREAEALAAAGVRELLVISQDTSAYGSDIRYREVSWRDERYASRFIDLARALARLGIWVRLHYVYPYPHVDALIPLMSEHGVLPYLDIPFQHGSPTVLKRMRRPAHAEDTLRRIESWRAQRPELTLRSTFIVGFPGETDTEFEQLLSWLDAAQLDRVGCFKYSAVEGAEANAHRRASARADQAGALPALHGTCCRDQRRALSGAHRAALPRTRSMRSSAASPSLAAPARPPRSMASCVCAPAARCASASSRRSRSRRPTPTIWKRAASAHGAGGSRGHGRLRRGVQRSAARP